ncbi:MAG: hypothetical protein ACTS10_13985 [Kiloniellales bacterium]
MSPRALLAWDGATAQAEALAGSPQAALHEDYLAQLDRLAAAGIADPEVHGQIADLLTADYERLTAALQAAKATALEETYRGLRAGETTPATLPPDLAEALSEVERAETQAWWREGLAVEPDAALFEALSALPLRGGITRTAVSKFVRRIGTISLLRPGE